MLKNILLNSSLFPIERGRGSLFERSWNSKSIEHVGFRISIAFVNHAVAMTLDDIIIMNEARRAAKLV